MFREQKQIPTIVPNDIDTLHIKKVIIAHSRRRNFHFLWFWMHTNFDGVNEFPLMCKHELTERIKSF